MTRLRVDETWSRYQEEDPRVFSYVLANARNLNTLTLTCQMVKPDDALKQKVFFPVKGLKRIHLFLQFFGRSNILVLTLVVSLCVG